MDNISLRKQNYERLNLKTQSFLEMLYKTKDNYIHARSIPKYDNYLYLEDVILTYDSALSFPESATQCLKLLGVDYLEEIYDPLIAAADRILQVLTDKTLFQLYTSDKYKYKL